MFKTILAATTNPGKVKEIKEILSCFEVISLKEAGIDVDVEENGETFSENAYIKAAEAVQDSGQLFVFGHHADRGDQSTDDGSDDQTGHSDVQGVLQSCQYSDISLIVYKLL